MENQQNIEAVLEEIRTIWKDRFKGNFTDAAAFFGVPYGTFHSWMTREGRTPTMRALAPALKALNVTIHMPDGDLADYRLIKKVVAKAGAGSSLETSDEVDGLYAFRSDFFEKGNLSASSCILLDVSGDSMRPTLQNGDLILVDTSETQVTDGKIFLLTFKEELLVKRVFHTSDGILLRSDNRDFPEREVLPPDRDQFKIHGRVRWVGKDL